MQPSGSCLPWEWMHQLSLQQGPPRNRPASEFHHRHKWIRLEQLHIPSGIFQMGLSLLAAEGLPASQECLPGCKWWLPTTPCLPVTTSTHAHSLSGCWWAASFLCTPLVCTCTPAERVFNSGADLLGSSAAAGLRGCLFVSSRGACLRTVASYSQAVLTHEGWQAQPARNCFLRMCWLFSYGSQ